MSQASRSALAAAFLVSTAISSAAWGQTREQLDIPTPKAPDATAAEVRATELAASNCPPEIASSQLPSPIKTVRFVGPRDAANPQGAALPGEVAAILSRVAVPQGDRTIRVICEVRDAAADALRNAGYVSSVQILPQRLESDELELTVILARLSQVRIIGSAGRYDDLLAARVAKLRALTPLNQREAERILLLTNDVPGLSVRLDLRPSPSGAVGDVVGDLTVSYSPVTFLANVQNYGSRQLGRETGYISAAIAGLTRMGDVTTLAASSTADFEEQQVYQVGHRVGLGSDGVTFGITGTFARSKPDLGALDLRSRTAIGTAEVVVPIVRTIATSFSLAGGFELIEQRTRVYGGNASVPLNRDRLRVAYLRANAQKTGLAEDGAGRVFERYGLGASLELRHGLGIFSASQRGISQDGYSPSRPDGNPEAFVVRGDFDARFALNRIFSVAGQAQVQWSNDPLLNLEEYAIGNLTIGRGYDPGANSGDRAVALRAELRADLLPTAGNGKPELQLFGFYDHVQLWNLDAATTEDQRLLRSYGGGVRFRLTGLLGLEAMYARPIDPALRLTNAARPTDRVLLSLTVRFAPNF